MWKLAFSYTTCMYYSHGNIVLRDVYTEINWHNMYAMLSCVCNTPSNTKCLHWSASPYYILGKNEPNDNPAMKALTSQTSTTLAWILFDKLNIKFSANLLWIEDIVLCEKWILGECWYKQAQEQGKWYPCRFHSAPFERETLVSDQNVYVDKLASPAVSFHECHVMMEQSIASLVNTKMVNVHVGIKHITVI